MKLHVLPAGMIETNAYLLTDSATGEAVLIDAPGEVWPEVKPILESENCRLKELWITHGHWDHMQGAAEIQQAVEGLITKAHGADRVLLETPEVMEVFLARGISLKPVKIDQWVEQGNTFTALNQQVEVRHVPGHCPGNILFYFPGLECAFVGDAIFARSVGRTDLPGGNHQTLLDSIRQQIYTLPDTTTLYPGHGPATNVAVEKRENPFVRL